jgi:hypothetical protein
MIKTKGRKIKTEDRRIMLKTEDLGRMIKAECLRQKD